MISSSLVIRKYSDALILELSASQEPHTECTSDQCYDKMQIKHI
jgi:hypothetical protein